jgi:drug/metabolite transporter (DMT)-like permease
MLWIYYSFAAAIALATADVLLKTAAGKIPNSLGMLLYGSAPFAAGLIWFIVGGRTPSGPINARGIIAGLGVGIMFSAVTFCMYAAFRSGAPISIASPLIRLGGLVIAAVAGVILWKEPITVRYVVGMAMICMGMFLLLTR